MPVYIYQKQAQEFIEEYGGWIAFLGIVLGIYLILNILFCGAFTPLFC